MSGSVPSSQPAKPLWLRLLPVVIIVGGIITLRQSGLTQYISLSALEEFHGTLRAWSQANPILGPVAVAGIYALGTALSVPGMVWVTLAAGFLFGTLVGAATVVTGATLGAVIIFLAARYAFADVLRAKAGRWLEKVDKEMEQGQISYLLTVRLIPVIPFWIANLVPAFLDVKARTFAWTTFVGIIPLVAVYCSVGAGFGTLIENGESLSIAGVLKDPKIIAPMVGLIAMSMLPIVLRKLRGRNNASAEGEV
ncbi:MAG: VTT domain-containing protein [Pseudomonadota bacterium]